MCKILMVLTSHNILGSTGLPTGFWLILLQLQQAPSGGLPCSGSAAARQLPRRTYRQGQARDRVHQ